MTDDTDTIKALVISVDGMCHLVDLPGSGSKNALGARQSIVGGMIEAVYFGPPGSDTRDGVMWINEEGKYTFGPDGYNGLATDLARHVLMVDDWIAGPIAIVGDAEHGNEASVPSWVVETVRSFPGAIWAGEAPAPTEETQ